MTSKEIGELLRNHHHLHQSLQTPVSERSRRPGFSFHKSHLAKQTHRFAQLPRPQADMIWLSAILTFDEPTTAIIANTPIPQPILQQPLTSHSLWPDSCLSIP